MQKSKFTFKKTIWLLLPFAISLFYLPGISSCKSGKKTTYSSPSCVKLTKPQIEKWVKNGYTDSNSADYMVVVRIKTAYAFQGTGFRVYAIGQRKNGSFIDESLTELSAVDTCSQKHISLSNYIFTGTNPIQLSDLNIVKGNGKINDSIQYIQFIPYTYTDTHEHYDYLAYEMKTVGSDDTTIGFMKRPLPCPPCPNCPVNACPPSCLTCGSSDSVDLTVEPIIIEPKDSISNIPK